VSPANDGALSSHWRSREDGVLLSRRRRPSQRFRNRGPPASQNETQALAFLEQEPWRSAQSEGRLARFGDHAPPRGGIGVTCKRNAAGSGLSPREPECARLLHRDRAGAREDLSSPSGGAGEAGLPRFVVGEIRAYLACRHPPTASRGCACVACGDELAGGLQLQSRGFCPPAPAPHARHRRPTSSSGVIPQVRCASESYPCRAGRLPARRDPELMTRTLDISRCAGSSSGAQRAPAGPERPGPRGRVAALPANRGLRAALRGRSTSMCTSRAPSRTVSSHDAECASFELHRLPTSR